jgi:diguanylate cyclase (GGDEF)-like protein
MTRELSPPPPRPDAPADAAWLAFDLCDVPGTRTAVSRARAVMPRDRAEALAQLVDAAVAVRDDQPVQALQALAAADAVLPRGIDPRLDADRDLVLADLLRHAGQHDQAIATLQRAEARGAQADPGAPARSRIVAAWLHGRCLIGLEQFDAADQALQRAQRLAGAAGLDLWQQRAALWRARIRRDRALAADAVGDARLARRHWRAALAHAAPTDARQAAGGSPNPQRHRRLLRAQAALHTGDLALADHELCALEAHRPPAPSTQAPDAWRCALGGLRARWHAAQGEHDQAQHRLDEALTQADRLPLSALPAQLLDVAIDLAARRDDPVAEAALLRRQRALHEAWHRHQAERQGRIAAALLETEQALREAAEARARRLALDIENRALRQRTEALNIAVHQDALTGLTNRRGFDAEYALRHAQAVNADAALPVAMVDIDFFKRVNDTHGHPAGDAVLARVAALMRQECRQTDLVARLGGEEFVVVFHVGSVEAARAACERIRAAVAREPWSRTVPGTPVTVSIGLADAATRPRPEDGLGAADVALYRAKTQGRDRVVIDEADA